MIKRLPFAAKIAWWLSIAMLVGLAALSIDTWTGVQSGRYDSIGLVVFNYFIIPAAGIIIFIWAVVFFVLRLRKPQSQDKV